MVKEASRKRSIGAHGGPKYKTNPQKMKETLSKKFGVPAHSPILDKALGMSIMSDSGDDALEYIEHAIKKAQSETTRRGASTQVNAADFHKLKEIAQKFEKQLKKEGAPGVEVTFISDDEINIFSEDKHAFDKAKQILKKVPGLAFNKEDVDNDPDFDGPQYHAWFKF